MSGAGKGHKDPCPPTDSSATAHTGRHTSFSAEASVPKSQEEDPQWATVYAKTNELRVSREGPHLNSLKKQPKHNNHNHTSSTAEAQKPSNGTSPTRLQRSTSMNSAGSNGNRSTTPNSRRGSGVFVMENRHVFASSAKNGKTVDPVDEKSFDSDFDARESIPVTAGGAKRKPAGHAHKQSKHQSAALFGNVQAEEVEAQTKELEQAIEKQEKYSWDTNFLLTHPPLTNARLTLNTSFLRRITETGYKGNEGIPKPVDPKVGPPPTTYKAVVVSCGTFQDGTIASYPQASVDGSTLAEVLTKNGYEVTHLTTAPLEAIAKKRLQEKMEREEALAIAKATGKEIPPELLKQNSAANTKKIDLEDCYTESSDSEDGDNSEDHPDTPKRNFAVTSFAMKSQADLTRREASLLPTRANIRRELGRLYKCHKSGTVASSLVFFIGRSSGQPMNVNEFSCSHPLKLMACYDTDAKNKNSYFPVETFSALKLDHTMTVADLAASHPGTGYAWLHAEDPQGGMLEFEYPHHAKLGGFHELHGPRCGLMISLVTRALRGKAARAHRVTPNNVCVFVGHRLMHLGWKFYTSATPLQDGHFDMISDGALTTARKDMRAFSHAKWKLWSSFRLIGLVSDSVHKDFSTTCRQLLYNIRHSKHIHFGEKDTLAISSMLTDGHIYVTFHKADQVSKYAATLERVLRDHNICECAVEQQMSLLRVRITCPKPEISKGVDALKAWIKEKVFGGVCRVFCGVEVYIQSSQRGQRKLDWAMRCGFLAPLVHVESMEVDCTTQMRGQLHAAVQIQAWYRMLFHRKRLRNALRVLAEYHVVAKKEFTHWQSGWKPLVDTFFATCQAHILGQEAANRPEQEQWEQDYRMDINLHRRRAWTLLVLESRGRYFDVRPLRTLQRRGSHYLHNGLRYFGVEYHRDPASLRECPLGVLAQDLPSEDFAVMALEGGESAPHVPEEDSTDEQQLTAGTDGYQNNSASVSSSVVFADGVPSPNSASQSHDPHLPPFSIVRSRAEIAMEEEESYFFLMAEHERRWVEILEAREFPTWSWFLNIPWEVQQQVDDVCAEEHAELLQIISSIRRFLVVPTNRVNDGRIVLAW